MQPGFNILPEHKYSLTLVILHHFIYMYTANTISHTNKYLATWLGLKFRQALAIGPPQCTVIQWVTHVCSIDGIVMVEIHKTLCKLIKVYSRGVRPPVSHVTILVKQPACNIYKHYIQNLFSNKCSLLYVQFSGSKSSRSLYQSYSEDEK